MNKRILSILTPLLLVLFLVGCGGKQKPIDSSIPVTTFTANPQQVSVLSKSVGTITSTINPVIRSKISGTVEKIYVREGDAVKKGQVIALLHAPDVQGQYQQQLSQYKSAVAEYKEKQTVEKSYAALVGKGIVSKLQYASKKAAMEVAYHQRAIAYKKLQETERAVDRLKIRATITGAVQAVFTSQGELIDENNKLFQLIDPRSLEVKLPFSEKQIGQFSIGQQVNLVDNDGKNFSGEIVSITPSINPNSRSFEVIVKFLDPKQMWHPGTSIMGHVFLTKVVEAIAVPTESLVLTPQGKVVFTVNNGKAYPHRVTVLEEKDGKAAIETDIKQGEQIVAYGAQYLYSEAPVKIKNRK